MENQEITDVIGNPAAPYLNGLATSNALGTQVYAVTHPSLPNYLALAGGSTFGITDDCTTCYVSAPNLADQIEAGGKTWKAYLEGMPSPCFVGDSYPYMQKHNPWIYFNDIRTNATRCAADVVPYSQLSSDLANNTVPNFVWITPDMCSDMHDCSITTGDAWLKQQVPAILNSAAYKNGGALFITWDESEGGDVPIGFIALSPLIKPGYTSQVALNHSSTLRSIEEIFGVTPMLGGAASATDLGDLFKSFP